MTLGEYIRTFKVQIAVMLSLLVLIVAAIIFLIKVSYHDTNDIRELRPLSLSNFLSDTSHGGKIALVYFYSPRCKFCTLQKKSINELRKAAPKLVSCVQINIDAPNAAFLVRFFNIRTVPTIYMYKQGLAARFDGLTSTKVLMEKVWNFEKSRLLDKKSSNWIEVKRCLAL